MARTKTTMSAQAAMPADGKPTLKTIAQISGLAVPTVSRALNNAPDIGSKTKELVRKIAQDIGYVPNRAGVRLRTGRTNVISLVISTEHDNQMTRLISSVASKLDGTRFHLNVTPYSPLDDIMKPVRYIVETGSADAIILNQIEPEDARVAYLQDRKFPFATHGRSKWAATHAYYDFDNAAFGRLATDQLAQRKRGSIMAIAPPIQQSYSRHFIDGLHAGGDTNGQIINIVDGVTSDDKPAIIIPAIIAYLRANPRTDAIVAASSTATMASVVALETLGLTVGQDIDVISKEGTPFLKMFRAQILTVSESVDAAGEFLALAAIQAIKDPDLPPMQFLEIPDAT